MLNLKREFLYNDPNKVIPIQLLKMNYGIAVENPDLSVIDNVDTSYLNVNVGTDKAIGYLIDIGDDIIIESQPAGSNESISFKRLERGKRYWVYVVSKDYNDGYITATGLGGDVQSDRRVFTFREDGEDVSLTLVLSANENDNTQWYNYAGSYQGELVFYPESPDYTETLNEILEAIGAISISGGTTPPPVPGEIVAEIGASSTSLPNSGGSITFTDKSQNSTSREWTFVGGTPTTSTSQVVSVTYPKNDTADNKTHLATLKAIGSNGAYKTVSVTITIPKKTALQVPSVSFNLKKVGSTDYSIRHFLYGDSIVFTNTSTNAADVKEWLWDYDDGKTFTSLVYGQAYNTYRESEGYIGRFRPRLTAVLTDGTKFTHVFNDYIYMLTETIPIPILTTIVGTDGTNYNVGGGIDNTITEFPKSIVFILQPVSNTNYKFELVSNDPADQRVIQDWSINTSFQWNTGIPLFTVDRTTKVYYLKVSQKRVVEDIPDVVSEKTFTNIITLKKSDAPVSDFEEVYMPKIVRKFTNPAYPYPPYGSGTVEPSRITADISVMDMSVPGVQFYRPGAAATFDKYQWVLIKYKNPNSIPFSEYPNDGPLGTKKVVRLKFNYKNYNTKDGAYTWFRYVFHDDADSLVRNGITIDGKTYACVIDTSPDAIPYYAYEYGPETFPNARDKVTLMWHPSDSSSDPLYNTYDSFSENELLHEPHIANGWKYVLAQGATVPHKGADYYGVRPGILNEVSKSQGATTSGVGNPFVLVQNEKSEVTQPHYNTQEAGQLAILMNIRFLKNVLKSIDENMWGTINNTNRVIMDSVLAIKSNLSNQTNTIFNITSANVSPSNVNVAYKQLPGFGWKPMTISIDDGDIAMLNLTTIQDFNNMGKYVVKIEPVRITARVDRVINGVVYVRDDLNGYTVKNAFYGWNIQFADRNLVKIGDPKLVVGSYYSNSEQRIQVSPVMDGQVNSGDKIYLWSSSFVPVMIEVDVVEHNALTLSYADYGKKELNTNTGLCTIYDHNGNIYKQFSYGKILNQETGFDLIEYRDPIR